MDKGTNKVFASFAERTSAHGLPQIYESKYRFVKLTWTALFLVAAIYAFIQVWSLFAIYWDYPTKVILEISNEDSLLFPSVTLCHKEVPMNLLKNRNNNTSTGNLLSSVSQLERLLSIFQEMKNRGDLAEEIANKLPPLPLPNRAKRGILDDIAPVRQPGLPQPSILAQASIFPELAPPNNFQEEPNSPDTARVHHASSSSKDDEGQRNCLEANDFILKCSFDGVECNITSDFITSLHPTYCGCHTYSLAVRRENNLSGKESGLKLKLFLNPAPEDVIGRDLPAVEVLIGYPFAHQYLTNVRKVAEGGHQTEIQLAKTKHVSSPLPVSDCTEQEQNEVFKGIYTTEACKLERQIASMVNQCNCISANIRYEDVIRKYPGVPACDSSEKSIHCLASVLSNLTNHQCKVPCIRHVYEVDVNTFEWPTTYDTVVADFAATVDEAREKPSLLLLYEQVSLLLNATQHVFLDEPLLTEMLREMITKTFLKDIFVELNIYYKDLIEEVYKLERSYDFESFLGDIGGHLGLWLGFSVLTICECIQLVTTLLCKALPCCTNSSSHSNDISQAAPDVHGSQQNKASRIATSSRPKADYKRGAVTIKTGFDDNKIRI